MLSSTTILTMYIMAVIIIALVFCIWKLNKKYNYMCSKVWEYRVDYQRQVKINDELQAFIGNDYISWTDDDSKDIAKIEQISPEKVVVISGWNLDRIYNLRFQQGITKNPSQPTSFLPSTDKRLDGLYRDHVNELRDIAKEFHSAGQLRARISDKVLGFREKLNSIQRYTNVSGLHTPPVSVAETLPKELLKREKSFNLFTE